MSYWEKRKEHDMYEAMKSAEETSQEIAEIYARASRELNYQISKIYERYRDKYDMTDEEALRLLNAMKDPADIDELKMKLQGLEGEAAKEILKELESPAYRARIKRLENLQDEIDRKMKEVYKQEKKISTDHYIDQYQQSYYREIFDTKKMTGLDFSFSKVDPKRLDKVLHSNWSGANSSKRIWNNTEELAEDLKKEISLAYLTGKAERDIAHDIALKYATGASNARRLVRTESAYISGQAQAAADEECSIDKYRIVATLDLRTSKICQEMDGKEFAYKDMKVGENYPPFHPYCRTTVISVLDDQDLEALTRRARDPETGKNKTVPANMTYQEWYEKEVEGKGLDKKASEGSSEEKPKKLETKTSKKTSKKVQKAAGNKSTENVKTLKEAPKINNKYMSDKRDDFDTFLINSKGNETVQTRLIMEVETTEVIEDLKMGAAYAYDPSDNKIHYNPVDPDFKQYDMNYVYAHELTHKMDQNELHSWEDKTFIKAIDDAQKIVYANINQIEAWFDDGGVFEYDGAVSDIISALTKGITRILLPVGHDTAYWNADKTNVPMEVLANMAYITLKQEGYEDFIGMFGGLIKAFDEVVKWKV